MQQRTDAHHARYRSRPPLRPAQATADAVTHETTALDENHRSRRERQTAESTRRCRSQCESGTGPWIGRRARPSLRQAIGSRASALLVDQGNSDPSAYSALRFVLSGSDVASSRCLRLARRGALRAA